jgi:hypothetical protein
MSRQPQLRRLPGAAAYPRRPARRPQGRAFEDRWYQIGDRWYRFADQGFGVRAGFREHRLFFYAYEDVVAVQRVTGAGAAGRSADVWVTLRRRGADGRPVRPGGPAGTHVLVVKGVEEWAGGGGNAVLDFLRLQMGRARLQGGAQV